MQSMIQIEEAIERLKAIMDEPETNEIQTGSASTLDVTKALQALAVDVLRVQAWMALHCDKEE